MGLAILGLLVGFLCLIPGVGQRQFFPLPLLLGSAIYLAGGILLALSARGAKGKQFMVWLRFVRMGFIVIFVLMLNQMGAPR